MTLLQSEVDEVTLVDLVQDIANELVEDLNFEENLKDKFFNIVKICLGSHDFKLYDMACKRFVAPETTDLFSKDDDIMQFIRWFSDDSHQHKIKVSLFWNMNTNRMNVSIKTNM